MTSRPSCEAGAVRVLVADSRRDVRSALKLMLEQDGGIVVSAEATKSAEVVEGTRLTCPDVIILDCELPGIQTEELLPMVRSSCPKVWIVALSARSEARQAALSAGADVFLTKTEPPQKLLTSIRLGSGGRDSGGCGSRIKK